MRQTLLRFCPRFPHMYVTWQSDSDIYCFYKKVRKVKGSISVFYETHLPQRATHTSKSPTTWFDVSDSVRLTLSHQTNQHCSSFPSLSLSLAGISFPRHLALRFGFAEAAQLGFVAGITVHFPMHAGLSKSTGYSLLAASSSCTMQQFLHITLFLLNLRSRGKVVTSNITACD